MIRAGKLSGELPLEALMNEEKLINFGWQPVPFLDGERCYSWQSFIKRQKNTDFTDFFEEDWVT